VTVSAAPTQSQPPGSVNPNLPIITCALTIDNPHKSTHVPSTVNVVAHWICDYPVASLSMNVQLFFGVLQVGSGHSANVGQASLNGNAASNGCVTGTYYGYVQGTVTFPPGYTPQSAYRTNASQGYVTC
jgi:hypothetical protein